MWKIYALLSALCAALTAIFAKVGVSNIDSNLATAIRTSVVMVLVWCIVLFSPRANVSVMSIQGHTWIVLILSGLFTGLSWLFYFKAIQLGDVSRVAPIDKLSVVFVVILGVIFLRETVTLKEIIGVLLIAAGGILMIWK